MPHDIDSYPNLSKAFFELATKKPELQVYTQARILTGGQTRVWQGSSYNEVRSRVERLAGYLKGIGVGSGTKVAIISGTRPEWVEADLAILSLGGVAVSVYPSLLAKDVGYILYDSEAEIVFAENEEQVRKLEELLSHPCHIPATETRAECEVRLSVKEIITFEPVSSKIHTSLLSDLIERSHPWDHSEINNMKRDTLATLVYTSGTTGPPRGVMQTHGNHLSNIRQARQAGIYTERSTLVLVLPLAHSFARLMGYIGFLTEARLAFPAITDTKSSRVHPLELTRDIQQAKATIVPIVPRFLEKMQAGIIEKAHDHSFSSRLLDLTLRVSKEIYECKTRGERIPFKLSVAFILTNPIRKKIKHTIFGPNLEYVVSGGAKLPLEVARFFDGLGIPVLEGYGLTETCVATNVNRINKIKLGTVGPVLAPDIEIKIAQDGEILFKGPNVATLGYYRRPKASADAFDKDGWFHTGDLGSLDQDGYLTIDGRKKEIIITSGGKNISPDNIEQKLRSSKYISHALLVGDGRPYCVALITLLDEVVRAAAKISGIKLNGDLHNSKEVHDLVWRDVEAINKELASFESVKRIKILPGDFSLDNALLTPSFKMKRKEITKRFAKEIEELYS